MESIIKESCRSF